MEIYYWVNTAGDLVTITVTIICLSTHKIFCVKILCKYATSSLRYKYFSEDMQIVIQ